MGLVTEYPSGLILVCILLGVGYAFLLYSRDLKKGLKSVVVWGMFILRFLSVFLISVMILGPLIKQTEKLIEKPIVLVGIDNSRSILLAGDSDYYRTAFPSQITKMVDELKKKCEVKIYSIGTDIKNGFNTSFNENQTDLSAFFNEVINRYANRNAAALIIATDGIYNQGTDPFYASRKITYPIYTIALGDTNIKKDILIRQVNVNKTVYKGDKFPIEVIVEMNKCKGLNSRLSLYAGIKVFETHEFKASGDRFQQKISFLMDAKETGMQKYSVRLDGMEGEISNQNNRKDFFVEVLDTRQKIALVSAAPHPDITAIQKALEGSSHFEIDFIRTDSLPKTYDKYDLIILNQLPGVTSIFDLNPMINSRASFLYIIGSQTDINAFNSLKTGLIINATKNSFSESQPAVNDDFSLFTLSKKDAAFFNETPPLQSPFGVYQVGPLTEVLLFQKISAIATRMPLIMFSRTSEKKIGIIAGENIWRWRMYDFIQQSNHESFDLLIDKIVQYLSTKDDKSFFRVHVKSKMSENERIEMEAAVYNASYELVNDPDVNITITDEEGKSYPFVFSKSINSYYLNAGLFPVGEYSYKATTKLGSSRYQKSGRFFIEQMNIESSNLVADHHLLFRIASAHDGNMISRDSIAGLADKITSRQDIRSVSIYQKRMTGLIENPWLFATILILLTAEWILRKREGK